MADVANLGLAVDSSQVVKGSKALDDLSSAAKTAEKSGGALMSALSSLERSLSAIEAAVRDVEKAVRAMNTGAGAANSTMGNLSLTGAKVSVSFGKMEAAAAVASSALSKAEAQTTSAISAAQGHVAALNAEAAAATKAAAATSMVAKAVNDNAKVTKAAYLPTANLAAQFQDIAVTAAMGMSPLQIALQQGTQIAGAFGSLGAAGAVSALGGAFASLVSPVALAALAFTALAAAGIQYVMTLVGQTETLDDRLKAHKEIISGIKDAYGSALEGVDLYAKQSFSVLETQARASAIKLAQDLKSTLKGALGGMQGSFIDPNDIIGDKEIYKVTSKFSQFEAAITTLRATLQAGEPDVRSFREAIAAVASTDPANKKLQELAGELLKMTDEADRVDGALTAAQRAIAATGSVAAGNVGAIKQFRDALADLAKISLPDLSPRQKAEEAYGRAMSSATSSGARASADAAYIDSLKRIDTEEKKLADKQAARDAERASRSAARKEESAAERDKKAYGAIVSGGDARIAKLNAEAQSYGLTEEAAARLRAETDLFNQALQKGLTLTDPQQKELSALAASMAAVEVETRKAKESLDFAKDATKGFISDLRQGLMSGQSAFQAFGNAANNVLNKIISKIEDQLVNALFSAGSATSGAGGAASGVGGLLGGLGKLFGFASGGYTGGGASSKVAGVVHGGEYVFSKKATDRIGVSNLDGMHKRAKGYAAGGYVARSMPAANSNSQRAVPVQIGVTVDDDGRIKAYVKKEGDRSAMTGATAGAAVALNQTPSLSLSSVSEHQRRRG